MSENPIVFIKPKNVGSVTSLSMSQCNVLEREGKFPRKIPLSPGRKAWLLSDLQEWCRKRVAEHEAKMAAKNGE